MLHIFVASFLSIKLEHYNYNSDYVQMFSVLYNLRQNSIYNFMCQIIIRDKKKFLHYTIYNLIHNYVQSTEYK